MSSELPPTGKLRLNRDAQTKIGLQLRGMYSELVLQDLPEHLRELLERLDVIAGQPSAIRSSRGSP